MTTENTEKLLRVPRHHVKKCHPAPFHAILDGSKTFEIREWDDYCEGDTFEPREFDPTFGSHTGRVAGPFLIGRVIRGEWGLPDNLCVFSLLPLPDATSVVAPPPHVETQGEKLDDIRATLRPQPHKE